MGDVETLGFNAWYATTPLEEQLERLVRGLTYQDGWEFRLTRSRTDPILVVTWEVDDLDVPGQRTLLTGTVAFRRDYDDQALRAFAFDLWQMISTLEAHERLEQLRFDGRTLWDPHPPGSRGKPLVSTPNFSAPLELEVPA